MNVIEKVVLKQCQKIIENSSFSDKAIIGYSIIFENVRKNVEVMIVTKESEYKFIFAVTEKEVHLKTDKYYVKRNSDSYTEAGDNIIVLENIFIKGYKEIKTEVLDQENLQLILKTVASNHSTGGIKEYHFENMSTPSNFFSKEEHYQEFIEILLSFTELQNIKTVDPKLLINGIKKLEDSRQEIFNNAEYGHVNSVIFQKKLFLKRSDRQQLDCKIVTVGEESNIPLVYDTLLTIFLFSDQKLRQQYFEDLLNFYYNNLKRFSSNTGVDICRTFPLHVFQKQVKVFTPYVKLEIVMFYVKRIMEDFKLTGEQLNKEEIAKVLEEVQGYLNTINTSINELNECVLYPVLTREECYKIVKNKIGTSQYETFYYKLVPIDEREGNLGDYFKLKINIDYNGENNSLHLFVKCIPAANLLLRDLATSSFEKEEFYYLKLIPELIDLGLGDIVDYLPKCYFTRKHELLVFEDVSADNYKSTKLSVPFTYDMLNFIVRKIAKMHASSLLYEEMLSKGAKRIVRFDTKYEKYVEEKFFLTFESNMKTCNNMGFTTFLNMFDIFPDIPKKLPMEEFKKRAKAEFDLSFQKLKKSQIFRNVLCQGDCWAGNILFKKDENNTVIDCYIVDYQLTRYCPPAHDLFLLFYTSTDKETRTKYMSKLLDEYYAELATILRKYNVDLINIYTYEHFLDSCKYMRGQGLCHAAILLQFLLFREEEASAFLNDEEKALNFFFVDRKELLEQMQIDGHYRQRMRELIEDMYEFCENDVTL